MNNITQIQLNKPQPLPIRMLRLLDEAEESDDDKEESESEVDKTIEDATEAETDVSCNEAKKTKIRLSFSAKPEASADTIDSTIKKESALSNLSKRLSSTVLSSSVPTDTKAIIEENVIFETPIKSVPIQSAQLGSRYTFQTPNCPQNSIAKSVQSVPAKQSSIYDPMRYHNSEIINARKPLTERESAGSESREQKSAQACKFSYSQVDPSNLNSFKSEKPTESSTKRAIFAIESESKENKETVKPIAEDSSKVESKKDENAIRKTSVSHSIPTHSETPQILKPKNEVDKQVVSQNASQYRQNAPRIQYSIPRQSEPTKTKRLNVKNREYVILNVIGKGMSAEVLQVQDIETKHLRAIKSVNLNLMDKDSVKGCIEEIKMLYKLQAPCIVHMFDYEINHPYLFVVMELGETDLSSLLKSVIQEKKKLPFIMVLHYWMEMLSAVKYIHDNGVIHSDLKPANFILVKGRLKLIDFGIASNINPENTSVIKDLSAGTLNYISPEALLDSNAQSDSVSNSSGKYKISRKSDVWSLGCILYCLVYGVTPFQHIRNQWAKINAITSTKPIITYSTKRDDSGEPIPHILIDVIQKCLQHDPKSRPSVDDLLKVSYISLNKEPTQMRVNIKHTTLMKIKNALEESEWREFIEALNAT